MALKRFKTNRRLWFWISLVLFVGPWFVPMVGKHFEMPPSVCWVILFTEPSRIGESLIGIGMFSLLFGVPAVSIGWVLQSIIVMVRDARSPRTQNAA